MLHAMFKLWTASSGPASYELISERAATAESSSAIMIKETLEETPHGSSSQATTGSAVDMYDMVERGLHMPFLICQLEL
ncbi:hypothetical protein EVAR_67293_1 [Eumeta japonica]|uniref:Uncharacterized protein n=1 Tax=Eumeta variegata TaxID=151549 RepID=A0A4C1SX57_EUMVA|nr:hypothetical protein EVAR_67293_1 [Eumeta japonica]